MFTHQALMTQINGLAKVWDISENDHVLHMLPLYHIHGLVNVYLLFFCIKQKNSEKRKINEKFFKKLLCPISYGAKITLGGKFSVAKFFDFILSDLSINVFMAVPMIYSDILSFVENVLFRKLFI